MNIYKFYDTDISGREEYDISGMQYITLLMTCFKYCTTVAVIISPEFVDNLDQWEVHRIPLTSNVQTAYSHYGNISQDNPCHIGSYEIRHYQLNDDLKRLILSHTDSIFKWICGWGHNNPNDITFFRLDGSVFFSSIIHEGECTLSPTEGEDITDVLNQGGWMAT